MSRVEELAAYCRRRHTKPAIAREDRTLSRPARRRINHYIPRVPNGKRVRVIGVCK